MAKILVIDDELEVREVLKKTLEQEGHHAVTAPNARFGYDLLSHEPYDLVVLDLNMPQESGLSLLKKIRAVEKHLPIVIYSSILETEKEISLREAGATETIGKDLGPAFLAQTIARILAARGRIFSAVGGRSPLDLLIVDDDPQVRQMLSGFFRGKGHRILEASSGAEALRVAEKENISGVLLDVNMPGLNGLETLRRLHALRPGLGVIMVTGTHDDETVVAALQEGAYGYILKPFDLLYLELVVLSKLNIAAK